MPIYELQSVKPTKETSIPAITNISVSESVKKKDIDYNESALEFNSGKISEEAKKATEEKIHRVSELMNDYVRSIQRDIQIKVDNKTGDVVVKVISKEDGKVIREIPPEELLALAAKMEELSGAFFDQIV
ncbi:MAG: flagellar protein FlaG [Deltaproteobacteria bacterium]|nr:flagellar protein FlaG [Deltaproteobacteria bacterium]